MLLPEFEYHHPKNLQEISELIQKLNKQAKSFLFCSGGTDIIPNLKRRNTFCEHLISLSHLKDFSGIKIETEHQLWIGAQTKLEDLIQNKHIQEHLPAVAEAAKKIATPQIRRQGTVGGNLLADNRCIYFNQSEQNRLSHENCFKARGEKCHLVPNAKPGSI